MLKITRIVACGLVLLAILPLPYAFYVFLRIVITVIACYNAYVFFKEEKKLYFFITLAIAILFNPIVFIPFEKGLWIIIDLIVGIFWGITALKTKSED